MNNLTTRKIVLGLLMTLVLAFSVQSIADAVEVERRSSDDLQHRFVGQTFNIKFNVSNVSAGDSLTAISTPAETTLTRVRNINVTDMDIQSLSLSEAGTGHEDLVNGLYTLTYRVDSVPSDTTITVSVSDGTTTLEYIIYAAGLALTNPTLFTVPDNTLRGFKHPFSSVSNIDETAFANVSGTSGANANVVDISSGTFLVTYTVLGGGTVYVKNDTRETPRNKTLTTSGVAPVWLDMNSKTNKVTVQAHVQNLPDSQAASASVVVIYDYATAQPVSGHTPKQIGATSGQLDDPFVVKIRDVAGNNVADQVVAFTPISPATATTNGHVSPDPITVDPLNPDTDRLIDTTPNDGSTTAYTAVDVRTDSKGEASVFLVMGDVEGEYGVEVKLKGDTTTLFTFKANAKGQRDPSSINIVSGDGQRAGQYGEIEDPLVVVVRDEKGKRLASQTVVFSSRGVGTLSPDTTPASTPTLEHVSTNAAGEAEIDYTPPERSGQHTVIATIQATDISVSFTINGPAGSGTGTGTGTDTDIGTTTNTITISPSSSTGAPGDTVTVNVSSNPTGQLVTLSSNEFANTNFSPQSGITPFTSELTLPSSTGEYDFFAFGSIAGATVSDSVTVTVETVALGTLSITLVSSPVNGQQTIEVTARNADDALNGGDLAVTLTGPGISRTVDTVDGTGRAIITLPTTTVAYILTVSADGYNPGTITLSPTGQQVGTTPTPTPTPVSDPSRIQISGPATRSGVTANQQLDAPLLVQVLDDDGSGVAEARVIFRVRTGQGRLSERGNGRAVGVPTDSRGFARAPYTPTSDSSTVKAEVTGVNQTVTFTISTGSAPGTTTRDTDTAPGTISPVVHVGAAQRPPMLWVDSGKIYALVGANVQEFGSGVEGAMNIAVGGGKVYWTEKTGERGGTINSADLNGTNVQELASIYATPMGIAVDVTNSTLYWTNSSGRIQSANLDGSGITNVIPSGLEGANDIALAGGMRIGRRAGTSGL